MTNVIDLTVRISAKNPRGQYLARIDRCLAEVEDLLVLGRYYQKETVPELEQALGGLMRVRARLIESERSAAR